MYLLVFQTETGDKYRVYALYEDYSAAEKELQRLRTLPGVDNPTHSFRLFSLNTTELAHDSLT